MFNGPPTEYADVEARPTTHPIRFWIGIGLLVLVCFAGLGLGWGVLRQWLIPSTASNEPDGVSQPSNLLPTITAIPNRPSNISDQLPYSVELETLDQMLVHAPDDIRARVLRAEILERLERYDESLFDVNYILSLDPDHIVALVRHSRLSRYLGDFAASERDIQHGFDIAPDNPRIYHERGNLYLDRGDLNAAKQDFEHALELDPEFVYSLKNLGEIAYQEENYEQALQFFEQAIRIDPGYYSAHYWIGRVYEHQGSYEQAIGSYTEAILLNPALVSGYVHRGGIYHRAQQDYTAALGDYSRALLIRPESVEALTNRANLYVEMDNLGAASQDMEEALAVNPCFGPALYTRAQITYLQNGDADAVIRDLYDAFRRSTACANETYTSMGAVSASYPAKYLDGRWLAFVAFIEADAVGDLEKALEAGNTFLTGYMDSDDYRQYVGDRLTDILP